MGSKQDSRTALLFRCLVGGLDAADAADAGLPRLGSALLFSPSHVERRPLGRRHHATALTPTSAVRFRHASRGMALVTRLLFGL